MVTGVHKPWAVSGDNRPLRARWEEASAQLTRLGGTVAWMMSESCLVDMQAEIGRLTKAKTAEVWDQRLVDARCDFETEISTHAQLLVKIAKEQISLGYLATNADHLILNDVTPAMLAVPEPTQSVVSRIFPRAPRTSARLPGEVAKPILDVDGYREARIAMAREVTKLHDLLANMLRVFQVESAPTADKAKMLIHAQQQRIDDLEARLHHLEQRLSTPATRKRANG